MSGIAAAAGSVATGDQSQPLVGIVRQLLSAMSHRGGVTLPSSGRPSAILREAVGTGKGMSWADDHCALGAQLTPRTPEDLADVQPRRDPATGCVLAWDGRLDNREELAAALGIAVGRQPDSEFVLRAYLHWREGCAARLLGDFAFAVWDPRERSLFAARDPMGVCPLFYHAGTSRFLLASEVQALLNLPEVSREPDDVMVGESLLWWSAFSPVERTFYRDVRRVPPAHWLRWDDHGLQIVRYWDIDPRRQLRYSRREEYIEQYTDLLRKAVSCRLRSVRPIGILLSGGMDSSAVASVTGELAPMVGARAFHLQLAGDENDESLMAKDVAERAGISFRSAPLRLRHVLDELESYIRWAGIPLADLSFPNDVAMTQMAATENCGPLFTGDGSDEVFAFSWAYVADLLRSLQWGRLARTITPYSAYFAHPPGYFLKKSARYLVPRLLLSVWRTMKWRQAPPWIRRDFASRSGLLDRLQRTPPARRFPSFSAQVDYDVLVRGRRVMVDESRQLWAARLGLEYRFPYYDTRMLEFMFAVPWDLKVDGWRIKPFLRESGLLPEGLRNANRKANYNAFGDRQWQAQDWTSANALFESPPDRATAYLDLPEVRRTWHRFLATGDTSQRLTVLMIIVFFLWLRSNES